jgi:hypothetical protein
MGINVILSLFALVIFGTFFSSTIQLMTNNTAIADQNEYFITALSLGQSVIDEAKTKSFDQKTVSAAVAVPDSLTAVAALGRELGESFSFPDTLTAGSPFSSLSPGYLSTVKFNDIDDYKGYQRLIKTARADKYTVSVDVYYVSPTYPDSTEAVPTFGKQMKVTVSSPYLPHSVSLLYTFTY